MRAAVRRAVGSLLAVGETNAPELCSQLWPGNRLRCTTVTLALRNCPYCDNEVPAMLPLNAGIIAMDALCGLPFSVGDGESYGDER